MTDRHHTRRSFAKALGAAAGSTAVAGGAAGTIIERERTPR
jgi:hypothetical protein